MLADLLAASVRLPLAPRTLSTPAGSSVASSSCPDEHVLNWLPAPSSGPCRPTNHSLLVSHAVHAPPKLPGALLRISGMHAGST